MRCYWDEEGAWFYFEADAEGWTIRQIGLQGPALTGHEDAGAGKDARQGDGGAGHAARGRF